MTLDALLTVQEVANKLGISKYQIYRRIARGDFTATRVRGSNIHYLIPASSVETYIAAGGADVLSPPRRSVVDWMAVSEVARLTGYSRTTIRRMCADGRLPYLRRKDGRGHLKIPIAAVQTLLTQIQD